MSAATSEPGEFILSNFPMKVTERQLRTWIQQGDSASKDKMIDFVYHRLHDRYIEPLLRVPTKYKSGFLMMASACLMIETLQSFYRGQRETDWGDGRKSF